MKNQSSFRTRVISTAVTSATIGLLMGISPHRCQRAVSPTRRRQRLPRPVARLEQPEWHGLTSGGWWFDFDLGRLVGFGQRC